MRVLNLMRLGLWIRSPKSLESNEESEDGIVLVVVRHGAGFSEQLPVILPAMAF